MMTTTKRRAFSYLRFSTPEQMEGDSLRRQTSMAGAYCERNGLTLDTDLVFQDLGVSAYRGANAKRGALKAFMDAIDAGQVLPGDTLVVENFDRLSREQPLDAMDRLKAIVNKGVTVVSLVPELTLTKDTINSIAVILPTIIQACLANSESEKKTVRLGEVWEERRANVGTRKLTAKCPFWLRVGKTGAVSRAGSPTVLSWETIPEKVAIVRRVFKDCIDGYGLVTISKRLNADKVPTPQRGPLWGTTGVAHILGSRAVLGEYQPQSRRKNVGAPVKDYYPAIITEAEFEAAAAAIAMRKKTHRGRVGRGCLNLFVGKLRDARDRSPIYVVNKPQFKPEDAQRVVSIAARRGEVKGRYKSIPYRLIEGAFAAILAAIDHWTEKPSTKAAIATTEKKLAALAAKITKVQGQIAGDDDGADLLPVLQDLSRQKRELTQTLTDLKAEEAGQRKADLDVAHDLAGRLHEGEEIRRRLKAKVGLLVEEMWVVIFDVGPRQRVAELQVFFKNGMQASASFGPRNCITSVGPIPAKWDLRKYNGWYDGPEEENVKATHRRDLLQGKALWHSDRPHSIEAPEVEPPPL